MSTTTTKDFFTAALGEQASAPARVIHNSRKRCCMDLLAFSLTPDGKRGKSPKPETPSNATFLIFQPIWKAVEIHNEEDCKLSNDRTTLHVSAYMLDEKDREQKKGTNTAVMRIPDGEEQLELGSVIEAQWGKDTQDEDTTAVTPQCVYRLTVNEVRHDIYKDVSSTRYMLTAFHRERHLWEMTAEEQEYLLAAFQLAPQVNGALTHLAFDGLPLPAEQLKTRGADYFNAATRHMKQRQHLMPKQNCYDSPGSLVRAQRHLPTFFYKENALSTTLADSWPRVSEKDNKKTYLEVLQFSVQGQQLRPRGVPPSLPLSAADIRTAYNVDDVAVSVVGYGPIFDCFWLCDRRHLFNQGAGRVLIANTPAAFMCYLKNECAVSAARMGSKPLIELQMGATGKKDEITSSAATALLAHGVVNAGYPIDKESAIKLMEVMHSREKMRYNTNMLAAPVRNTFVPPKKKINAHPLGDLALGENRWVFNVFESNINVAEADPNVYEFVVVSNVAEKCDAPQTSGTAYLRNALETLGEEGARKQLGEIFVQLAHENGVVATPADAVDVFRTNGSFKPDVMLFLVGRAFIADAQLDFCTTQNHERALERVFARLYPAVAKREKDDDAPEPANKRNRKEQEEDHDDDGDLSDSDLQGIDAP